MDKSPSRTIIARTSSQSSDHNGSPRGPDTSFFTFLVALLILAFASAALILRAIILRRRFRNRIQAAMDAGIIPRQVIPEKRPEFYEAYVRGSESGAKTWASVMPLTAAEVTSDTTDVGKGRSPAALYRPTIAGRMMELLGHRPTGTHEVKTNDGSNGTTTTTTTTTWSEIQLAVLIAMPSEYPLIGTLDESQEGKGKGRGAGTGEEGMPDVMIGVSSLRVG